MLIALGSVKGSPGTTTTTLALAATWPVGDALVAECDPAGGDLAARLHLPSTPGLVTLAAAVRHGVDPQVLWQHAWRPTGGPAVICGPAGGETARGAVALIAAQGARPLRAVDTVVLADCGRLDSTSVAMPILRAADVVLLVSHAHPDALAHLGALLPIAATWNRRLGLVLVGEGRSSTEIEHTLRTVVSARIPHDTKNAAVLAGRRRGSFASTGPLGTSARRLAATLCSAQSMSAPAPHLAQSTAVHGPPPREPPRSPNSQTSSYREGPARPDEFGSSARWATDRRHP